MRYSAFASGKTRGFSLVELMVSITIGLIILAAVATIMVSSKSAYNAQDRAGRVQENGRIAMQFLIQDLRLASYYGCGNFADNPAATIFSSLISSAAVDFFYQTSFHLEGINNAAGNWSPSASPPAATAPAGMAMAAGTDAITIRILEPNAVATVTAEMLTPASVINVDSTANLLRNDIVMLGDCSRADIFQITDVDSAANTVAHVLAGQNSKADLSKRYKPPATFMRFSTRTYYISTGVSGNRALFRITNGVVQELVDGIESLQILYGVNDGIATDTDADGRGDTYIPNVYLPASAVGATANNWLRVVSIRVGVLATALNQQDTDTDTTTYDVDGDGTPDFIPAAGDRNKRNIFQSTIALRNRQPFL
jgi:type IV pilus assembly protein PilW